MVQVPFHFLADLNGDGALDLLAKFYTPSGTLTEFYQNDGKGFFSRMTSDLYVDVMADFYPIDVNSDGLADFVTNCPTWTSPQIADRCLITASWRRY